MWDAKEAERLKREAEENEVSTMSYADMAEPELRQLVLDVCDNKVFTDRHCRTADEVAMAFPIILMMKLCDRKFIAANPPGMIWEYYSKAAPRSVNGLPMFFSVHFMSPSDMEKFHPMVIAEFERRAAFVKAE
jgi:hypothetical protein